MEWRKLFHRLDAFNWGMLFSLGVVSFATMSHKFTLGVIIGGLMVIANFYLLQQTIRQAFSPDGVLHVKKASIIAKFYLRLAAMGVIIYILIGRQWIHPVGLAIGLSVVVFSIVSFGAFLIWKTSSGEAI
jgi:hypothetical protein